MTRNLELVERLRPLAERLGTYVVRARGGPGRFASPA
jgi:hypothetical protein